MAYTTLSVLSWADYYFPPSLTFLYLGVQYVVRPAAVVGFSWDMPEFFLPGLGSYFVFLGMFWEEFFPLVFLVIMLPTTFSYFVATINFSPWGLALGSATLLVW